MGESNVGQVKLSRLFVEVSDKGPLWTDLHSSMHSHNVISDTNQKVWDLRRWARGFWELQNLKLLFENKETSQTHTDRTPHCM